MAMENKFDLKFEMIRSNEKMIQLDGFIGNMAEEQCRKLCEEYITHRLYLYITQNEQAKEEIEKRYKKIIDRTIFQYKCGNISSITDIKKDLDLLVEDILHEGRYFNERRIDDTTKNILWSKCSTT